MKQSEIKRLRNHFELLAIYIRQFENEYISKEEFLHDIALLSKITIDMLNI